MKILEVPVALRRADKYDLFIGDLDNLHGQQAVKKNTTMFYRNTETNAIEGPKISKTDDDFTALYYKMLIGKIGVITPMPERIKNEVVFDLVLREANSEDIWELNHTPLLYRMYYIYGNDQKLIGPHYISNQTNMIILQRQLESKEVFVPHEKQHFEHKEYKKIA